MKPVTYTRHAKNRMRWRRIAKADVASAIASPDFEKPALEGRRNVWKKFSDKYLKVTYKESEESILVVTAVNKNKGWR
jgi:hypothetical protein